MTPPIHRLAASLLLPVAFAATFAACGQSFSVGPDGQDVGGSCKKDADCGPDSFCVVKDGDFPSGTCSMECNSHQDCPEGSACISANGGICALSCESADQCRDGYGCESKSDQQGDGESRVCID